MAHGKDSLGRWWNIDRDANGLVVITPIGHNGDPDTDLSLDDEDMLMHLAPEPQDAPTEAALCAEDFAYEQADHLRDLSIDRLLGML